jgi:hypothetical protein
MNSVFFYMMAASMLAGMNVGSSMFYSASMDYGTGINYGTIEYARKHNRRAKIIRRSREG